MVIIVSAGRDARVPSGPHASRPATVTGIKASLEDAKTEAVTDGATTITVPGTAGSIQGDKEEFFIDRLMCHCRAKPYMRYRVCWNVYDPSENTCEPAELVQQLSIDRYWLVDRKKRPHYRHRNVNSTTQNRTSDCSRSELSGREKTATLRREVADCHCHRCSALDDEGKEKKSTARRAKK